MCPKEWYDYVISKNIMPMPSILKSLEEYELRNMLLVSKAIIDAALNRKESIGAHFRADSTKKQTESSNKIGINSEVIKNDSKIIA